MIAATDVADLLVRRGVPFRQSHGIVAGLVREAVESGRSLSELEREDLARHSDVLDDEFYAVLSQRSWLESKVSEGGTALDRVREQLAHARAELDGQPAVTSPKASGDEGARSPGSAHPAFGRRSSPGPWSTSPATCSAASCATARRRA